MLKSRTFLTLALGLAAVAGCKKQESSTIGADSSLAADSSIVVNEPAFRVEVVNIGNSIGADKRVVNMTTDFAVTDTIYASVVTEGSAPNKTIIARWTFEDGQVVSEETQVISPSGPAVTEFHIAKPTAWPAGKYKVEILVDGTVVDTKDFEVK